MNDYAVKFGETSGFYDPIEMIVAADSIYSLVVKASEMCENINKMHVSLRYQICEITLLED